jgi:hypothetical protein
MATTTAPGTAVTRRRLLGGGLAAGGAIALGGTGYGLSQLLGGGSHERFLASRRVTDGVNGAARRFVSRPDLIPATTTVTAAGRPGAAAAAAAGGFLLIGPAAVGGAQAGPVIAGGDGDPVWFTRSSGNWLTGFAVQSYRGAPVLTWWEGTVTSGYGTGEAVIVDRSYREVARVRAANGRHMDLHEFLLTDRGTALFTCTPQTVAADLRPIGGSATAHVFESVFQEVDVASGKLVHEWRSLDHVPVADSYRAVTSSFDYLHLNSIDVAPDGNLLLSARHTWALYKVDRAGGDVIWRLGGKRSEFAMDGGAQFAWQHDARHAGGSALTVFDDGDDGVTKSHAQSRAVLLDVDETARQVTLTRAFTHSKALLATAMGSARRLGDGNVVVGWGAEPYVTEFDAAGHVAADLRMGAGQKSYRGLRSPWAGRPADAPALAIRRSRGVATAYLSFNGATALHRWRLEGGVRRSDLRVLGEVPRRGFETAVNLGTETGYARAVALDVAGRELGASAVVTV